MREHKFTYLLTYCSVTEAHVVKHCRSISLLCSAPLVGFKPYLKDQLASFSALTLLVWSYDL